MLFRKQIYLAVFTIVLSSTYVNAGQPLSTEDASVVERGHVEVEMNGSFMKDRDTIDGVLIKKSASTLETKLSTGITNDTSISLLLPYTITKHDDGQTSDGFGDMTLEFKKHLGEYEGVHFALKPSLTIATGAERASDNHT